MEKLKIISLIVCILVSFFIAFFYSLMLTGLGSAFSFICSLLLLFVFFLGFYFFIIPFCLPSSKQSLPLKEGNRKRASKAYNASPVIHINNSRENKQAIDKKNYVESHEEFFKERVSVEDMQKIMSTLSVLSDKKEDEKGKKLLGLLTSQDMEKLSQQNDGIRSLLCEEKKEGSKRFTVTISDIESPIDKLKRFRELLSKLIEESRKVVEVVDHSMVGNLQSNTAGSINGVLNIHRIIGALEKRLLDIDTVLESPELVDSEGIVDIMNKELLIENDSLSSLSTAQKVPPLKPSEWYSTLASLFHYVTRKRNVFKECDTSFFDTK